ncbi:chromosome segregation protein SMC [Halobacteriales archaeon QH_7_69_31]|nr:MAG: chromosome segregation protein SMC [Halobacteriales archaeon QH_7_69_31]
MAGNRVDELEVKVQELQATIDGLTDELVETKERLHALEGADDGGSDILAGQPTRGEPPQEAAAEPPADKATTSPGAEPAEADTPDEVDGGETAESGSGDDIIVA